MTLYSHKMNTKPFTPIWFPGESGYKEHIDRQIFSYDNIGAIKEQTNEIKDIFSKQSLNYADHSSKIIASNDQIISAIDDGFNRLSQINNQGFNQVTSAIEDLHSNLNYLLGIIIQKLDYQNRLLEGILNTLQEPFETQVKEYYRKGCLFIQQGFLEAAVNCLKESISLKMGEYFFPSYYQLGRLYLSGVTEDINIVEPKTATRYLLKANEFGNGIIKTDPNFKKVLADCKFFLSQSYYFQLTGKNDQEELYLINSAIKYCKEATEINPNLSQGWYHLTKYYAFRLKLSSFYHNPKEIDNLLICYLNAIELDRNYLRAIIKTDPFYDKVLESVKEEILKLINRLIEIKKKDSAAELKKAQNYISLLEAKNISNSSNYYKDFLQLKEIVVSAMKDFQTNTYFGFDDCLKKLDAL